MVRTDTHRGGDSVLIVPPVSQCRQTSAPSARRRRLHLLGRVDIVVDEEVARVERAVLVVAAAGSLIGLRVPARGLVALPGAGGIRGARAFVAVGPRRRCPPFRCSGSSRRSRAARPRRRPSRSISWRRAGTPALGRETASTRRCACPLQRCCTVGGSRPSIGSGRCPTEPAANPGTPPTLYPCHRAPTTRSTLLCGCTEISTRSWRSGRARSSTRSPGISCICSRTPLMADQALRERIADTYLGGA
jgi:hypothetical protein